MKKVREGYKMTELGEIPEEWKVVEISKVAKFQGGYAFKSSDYIENGVRLIKITNVQQGNLCWNDVDFLPHDYLNKYNEFRLNVGDVVIAMTRPIISSGIKICKVSKTDLPALLNQRVGRFIISDMINMNYLYYWCFTDSFINKVKELSSTTGQPNISSNQIESIFIAIPSIKEQEKIASVLSTVDEQIDNVENLIEKHKELKKGLMQQLLTKGIGHTKFKKTEIGEIPEEWEVKKFKDISKVCQGLQIAIEDRFKEYSEGRLPYITIQYLNDKKNQDNQYFIEEYSKNVICYKDDILMTRTGNTGIIITNEHGIFHNNFFKVDYNKDLFYKDFLVYYLRTSFMTNLVIRYAGTTTIPDLKHGDFYKLPVIIPSLQEQKKIASILSSVDSKIDDLEDKKIKLDELKKGLMQQLLTGNIRVN